MFYRGMALPGVLASPLFLLPLLLLFSNAAELASLFESLPAPIYTGTDAKINFTMYVDIGANKKQTNFTLIRIGNPRQHFHSYAWPNQSLPCGVGAAKTSTNSLFHECILAINGGPGHFGVPWCEGVVISDGQRVENVFKADGLDGGFGMANGTYYMGKFKASDFQAIAFDNYMYGMNWLVRSGKVHGVNVSDPFVAARTSVGWNAQGELMFLEVDGVETAKPPLGLTMLQLALYWLKLGAVNAYNFDGGGSSTVFYQGKVTNQPHCNEQVGVVCERIRPTIMCIK